MPYTSKIRKNSGPLRDMRRHPHAAQDSNMLPFAQVFSASRCCIQSVVRRRMAIRHRGPEERVAEGTGAQGAEHPDDPAHSARQFTRRPGSSFCIASCTVALSMSFKA